MTEYYVSAPVGTAPTVDWKIGTRTYTFYVANVSREDGKRLRSTLDLFEKDKKEADAFCQLLDKMIQAQKNQHLGLLWDMDKALLEFALKTSKNRQLKQRVGKRLMDRAFADYQSAIEKLEQLKKESEIAKEDEQHASNQMKLATSLLE